MSEDPVFIVEDRALARRTLERQLAHMGRTCRLFPNAADFFSSLGDLAPGIVLLDIHMPGKSGLDLLDDMGPDHGPFAVVVLSGSNAVDDAIGAFRRGAVHFLRKPYRLADLANAIAEAGEVLQHKLRERDRAKQALGVRLSSREMEVLGGMARGLQSKAIAHELDISIRTVELHRSKLIAKLHARSGSHALSIAKDLGLLSS